MSRADTIAILWTWTPFLLGGFLWNMLISVAAMLIGTLPGIVLARMRLAQRRSVMRSGRVITELLRNIPTFVFLFYLAFLIPVEFTVGSTVYTFPAWLKAALALSVAVAGFVEVGHVALGLGGNAEGLGSTLESGEHFGFPSFRPEVSGLFFSSLLTPSI